MGEDHFPTVTKVKQKYDFPNQAKATFLFLYFISPNQALLIAMGKSFLIFQTKQKMIHFTHMYKKCPSEGCQFENRTIYMFIHRIINDRMENNIKERGIQYNLR